MTDLNVSMPRSKSIGPLVLAAVGAVLPAALLGLILFHLRIDLTTELWVFVPVSALAALAISISMGWIFIEFGREHRRTRQLPMTMVLLAVGVLELLSVIILIGLRTASMAV